MTSGWSIRSGARASPVVRYALSIRLTLLMILEAEETLARGDHIVEEMQREARKGRKAGEPEK